jgi:hypothetical protein
MTAPRSVEKMVAGATVVLKNYVGLCIGGEFSTADQKQKDE